MKRLLWIALATLVVIALAVGHVFYWYVPRLRPAQPEATSAPARLAASTDYPVALWVPFPHQNLGRLDHAVGGSEDYAAAVARLAELKPLRLPAFGPFRLPPSRELAIVASESGERFAVFADVYPGLAIFARLAGKVAGNPWLAGGEVELSGRPVEVAWRGSVWTVTSGAPPELTSEVEPLAEPCLGLFALRRATGNLPAGRFRLVADGDSFEVRSDAAVPAQIDFSPEVLDGLGGVLLLVTARTDDGRPAARVLGYFSQNDGKKWELPRVASLHQPGRERYKLPGEELLKLVGKKPRRKEVGSWQLVALDRASLAAAEGLVPELDALAANGRLVRGLWLDPSRADEEVRQIGSVLEQIPLVPRREIERSRDARTVLAPLAARFDWLSLVVADQPDALRLRLEAVRGDTEPGR